MSDDTGTGGRSRPAATTHSGSAAAPPLSVGFVGLGDQGLPMATAIAEAGHDLHVWARRPGAVDALGTTPYTRSDDLEALAGSCEVIGLCVRSDADVIDVATDLFPAMRAGAVLVNHGTGTVADAERLAALGGAAGVDVLDAPVSGGRPGAERRDLTTLVGGTAAAVERVRPVLESFSANVVHLGGAGAGQTAKLFNNILLVLNQANIHDTLALARRFGRVDPVELVEARARRGAHLAELVGWLDPPVTTPHGSDSQTS